MIEGYVTIPKAARIRECSTQAVEDLVKKGRFEVVEVIEGKRTVRYLNEQAVRNYQKQSEGGRPRKVIAPTP